MKRVVVLFVLLLVVVFCFFELFNISEEEEESKVTTVNITSREAEIKSEKTENKIYGIWLTYSEIGGLVKGKTEAEYRASLEIVFENLKANKINTVFYQCRAFCDSLYNSEIFPASKYITVSSTAPDFDPLEIFLEKAESYEISVHCWINPYRISYDSDFKSLPMDSPARKLYKDNKNNLLICDEGIFLNPAHEECRRLVLSGIREILSKYKVAGIHFDDYFYPEAEEINDKELYKEYKNKGGSISLKEWRRENVNVLISSVYSLVKAENEKLAFSISPAADIEKCKNVFYADVEKWCREEGFIDFIVPQLYFGFENEEMPFEKLSEEWSELCQSGNTKLVLGMAPYKSGRADEFAGKGENEWIENVNILSRQYEQMSQNLMWQGFSLFSYSYCFGENVTQNSKKEIKNLLFMIE